MSWMDTYIPVTKFGCRESFWPWIASEAKISQNSQENTRLGIF